MNLTVKPITLSLPERKQVFSLYHAAFPKEERFSDLRVWYWLLRRWVEGLAYYDGGVFQGFSLMVVLGERVFVQYLAVSPEARGKGVGSAILAFLQARYPDKTFFLDVEVPDGRAPNAEQRRKRIAFYERSGFHRTGVPFEMRGVHYEILSTDPGFSQQDLDDFWDELEQPKN